MMHLLLNLLITKKIIPMEHRIGDFKLIWYYVQLISLGSSAPNIEDSIKNLNPLNLETGGITRTYILVFSRGILIVRLFIFMIQIYTS